MKVRGFRIELGEIEAALRHHPAVCEVVVMAREDTPGEKRLVAYLVPEQKNLPATDVIRRFLSDSLPAYMVPAAFVTVPSIPQTPNGKIDRKALPRPEGLRPVLAASFVAPESNTERAIAALWHETLRLDKIGMEDNFFDLGGDSIMLVEVHERLKASFPALSVTDLFTYPTIRSLAAFLGDGKPVGEMDAAMARAGRQKAALERIRTQRGKRGA